MKTNSKSNPSGEVTNITVRVDGGKARSFAGREAWALDQLLKAGKAGVTTLQRPAPRWSHYVYLLRRDGVKIETKHECHGGPFSGHHGRYFLRSRVKRVAA